MKSIEAASGRRIIIYAADPMKAAVGPLQIPVFIFQEDVTPLIDIFQSVPEGSDVDMFVESPGGSAQGVELIVRLLRKRFRSVRFIVPHTAMSAATMLVMSGDDMLMDHRSSLGPIDPQIFRPGGLQYPAQSYLDWLDKAAEEEQSTGKLSLVTLAILQKVTPADIQIAEDATEEARRLVT
ncbi:MAG: SDH family Clp fold serine proteinase, partial [bacterium]